MTAPAATPPRPPSPPAAPPRAGATTKAATPAATKAATPARRRSWRWLRLVVPYAVVMILLAVTAIAYAIEEPDPTDAAFLSPTSTEDVGGKTLADRLRARGVTILRHTRTADALVAADIGDATLFIPAPDLLHSFYLRMLKLMPASTTVVLVRPDGKTLTRGRLPAFERRDRWATTVANPACGYGPAAAAGPAGVRRAVYRTVPARVVDNCYGGSVLRVRHVETTLTLVGATDPFRNDRIGEHGNADLAAGLLSTTRKVIWLDLHHKEPGPTYRDQAGLDERPAPADLGRGSPDPDFPVPDPEGTEPGEGAEPGEVSGGSDETSLADLFPAVAWTVLALLAVAALVAAAARARRLGAPVEEPLPVLVPATETVTGRGRLYQRSRDRGAALGVLRRAARERITHAFDLPPDSDPTVLVPALAERTGVPADEIDALLFSREPETDEELVAMAAALETLVAAVTRIPEGEPRD
jgi:hypothetical protein